MGKVWVEEQTRSDPTGPGKVAGKVGLVSGFEWDWTRGEGRGGMGGRSEEGKPSVSLKRWGNSNLEAVKLGTETAGSGLDSAATGLAPSSVERMEAARWHRTECLALLELGALAGVDDSDRSTSYGDRHGEWWC
ncbi:hypothetical protein AXG93_1200s1810 [Marchantia polymorpha subsp. ruderalis]|uniref:Uncharacterized protein n=1 Tax=Marchantia polymorpha subsp. ruderalis TaxID=1480154 RepID=A0A176WJV4_MARPO|nr:hypothetical protein AXG93_1200s1810 [Marchantia polymorpha subsp. ruderalis]